MLEDPGAILAETRVANCERASVLTRVHFFAQICGLLHCDFERERQRDKPNDKKMRDDAEDEVAVMGRGEVTVKTSVTLQH